MRVTTPIDRVTSTDLMSLVTDTGPAPMHSAAILVFEPGPVPELAAVRTAIAERIRAVPRLRQRLLRTPLGAGRPVWADDPAFDIRRHVGVLRCRPPGDEQALLDVAAEAVTHRLPFDRPLWAATLVTGLAGDSAALIVVLHHVLADGIGGLAVLAQLVDRADGADDVGPSGPDFPRPAPSTGRLYVDSLQSRVRSVGRLPAGIRSVRNAVAELRPGQVASSPARTLNRPTGPRRGLAVVRADLTAVREVAHAPGGTVNDVVLTAVVGALHTVLVRRGDVVDSLVVSVPVSGRRDAGPTRLGNQGGVFPVALPASGDPRQRLAATARITARHKIAARGASAALLAPAFRILARLGLFHWFVNRQRLVNTFVTNLRGPGTRLAFLGVTITDVIPVSLIAGNVTVGFAVLSYAGTLNITLVADPDGCPDLTDIAKALQSELDALTFVQNKGTRAFRS